MPYIRSSLSARIARLSSVFAFCALLLFLAAASGRSLAKGPAPASAGRSTRGPVLTPPEENSLPIGMTPEEYSRRGEIGTYTLDTPPPPGPNIRQCAEWEPVTGGLVRYPFGLPYNLLAEVARNAELWVLVANQSEQNTCSTLLQSNGVNMAHVHFIQTPTNSIWTRDYGPQFMFDQNGDQGIVDHHYNRPRPQDDQVNYALGASWSIPVYGTPLIHTGGNYMCDGHDNAFSTDLVYDENPGLTQAQVNAYMRSYLGITAYHVIPDIDPSGIHHIDCWAKLLDEQTLLVKQVPPNHPDYAQIEADVATFRTYTNAYGHPYKIVRVLCGSLGGNAVASYTNSLILNNKVLVPIFNIATDAAALATYQAAMPGYQVLPYTGSWLDDDAIHCRCMGIHDKYMLRVDVAPLPDTVASGTDVQLMALIDDRSEAGLKSDSLRVFWKRSVDISFQSIPMTVAAGPDSFYAYIPNQPAGTRVQYYVFAADQSNRRSVRPPSAPSGYFSYYVSGATGLGAPVASAPEFGFTSAWPNPFESRTALNFRIPQSGPVSLTVIDVQGRIVATLVNGRLPAGSHSAEWDGREASGLAAENGLYFFRLVSGGGEEVRRGVLIRR